jgi:hypothetical protein
VRRLGPASRPTIDRLSVNGEALRLPNGCRCVRTPSSWRRNAPVTPVETAWTKSTFCGSTTCVEIRRDGDDILMRDSKHPDNEPLRFGPDEWETFIGRIRFGDLAVM